LTSGDQGLSKPEPLLRVSALSVDYYAAGGDVVHALHNLDFEIAGGESMGLLGESGSGKSSLALALMGLLPWNARLVSGKISYGGRGLSEFSAAQLREMRGGEVALISQEPALALNPVLPLGRQIADVLLAHRNLSRQEVNERCKEMLVHVGFPDPDRIMRAYPHELSGGQRQRVAIAQALICRPRLLIADEPLSALDAATQAEILELLQQLKRDLGLAILFITHNAGVLAALADNIVVMRAGEVNARGAMSKLQASPDVYVQGILFPEKSLANSEPRATAVTHAAPLLEVRGLSKRFVQQRMFSRKKFAVQSLEGIDLVLQTGSTVAVLGRSGSGKSTLARCIAGFETADTGEILLGGKPFEKNEKSNGGARRPVQMIFQDAATSLNPRFRAHQIVAEPLEIASWKTEAERTARAMHLMAEVGLDPEWASRPAREFSGGQRQRLALARAMAAKPRLLIMDEALSGLDMPLQAQMVRLLMELQARHGLTYLYISHDLNFISLFAQEVVVMDAGRIVERTTPEKLRHSTHPATRVLVEAPRRTRTADAIWRFYSAVFLVSGCSGRFPERDQGELASLGGHHRQAARPIWPGPADACALLAVAEIFRQRRIWILFRLQHSGFDAALAASTQHSAAERSSVADFMADRCAARSAGRWMERALGQSIFFRRNFSAACAA
jgi:ABC-type glutathione transport system ATPase component